jgi:hypothetical protein
MRRRRSKLPPRGLVGSAGIQINDMRVLRPSDFKKDRRTLADFAGLFH